MRKIDFVMKRLTAAFLIIAAIANNLYIFSAADTEYPAKILTQIPHENYSGKVVILHSNDVHGAIEGYAKITQLKKDYESMGADVIMADAGDYSQGTPYVTSSKGADAIELMNAAGYDIATLGNHEFDYAYNRLDECVSDAAFVVTSANILRGEEHVFTPSVCISAENGLKIGFIGVETPETVAKTNPQNTKGLTFLGGKEMFSCVQNEIHSLKGNEADVIVALTHLGVDEETAASKNRSIDLYENTTGLDLIIDGHSHTVMTSYINGEPIQSTGTKFENIGVVVISENGSIEDNYLISAESVADDENVAKKVSEVKACVDNLYGEVFAKSEVEFDGTKETNRARETNSGDLITDAMLWYAVGNNAVLEVPPEDAVALENGGGIRASISKGNVTKKDLLSVFPFGNTVSVVNVSGSELLELLEASTFSLPDKLAGYPQTAGIKFTVDCTTAYDAGELYPGTTYNRPNSIQRVTIESINGKPFDINKTYAIVTNDFLAAGGDTAYILGQKENYETGKILDELLEEYITEELGGVLTAEKYANSRGDHTLITEKTSDSTETTEEESKEETTAETTLKTTSEKKNRTSSKSSGGGRSSNAAVKKSAESPSENTSGNAQKENDNSSATAEHKVSLTIGSTKIRLDNEEFDIPAAPYVSEDTNIVLVPLRFAAIAINGLDIENADASEIVLWDAQAKAATVKANNMTVVFKANSSIMTLNGREVYMENDAAAQIKDGRMYIPYEAFGDALGIKTELDIQSGSVTFEK